MVNRLRRAGLGAALAWWGAGCAVPDDSARAPHRSGAPALLTPWLTLTGGWRGQTLGAPAPAPLPGAPAPSPLPGAHRALLNSRLNFQWPSALAARDDVLLVADTGLRQLLRIERSRDLATPIAALPVDRSLGLHLGGDGRAWLVEPSSGLVRCLDRDGRELRRWSDDRLAARPVAVIGPVEEGAEVFVADAQLPQVVVFDVFGRAQRRFGEGRLQSVAGMTAGPDGLYVLDRLAQQVVVFDRRGAWRAAFGADSLVLPHAIAVDRGGRVFVADEADAAIHAFVGGQRVARLTGASALRLARIDALAVDANLLFAADSMSSRVQILLITPESLRSPS